ncbi:MAG: hypothetical protein KKB70_02915 [Proteobacteria bacterium]|nr:hypothetical protein [Pseudomonadota bacterium]MBU1612303.1 hypothetical protein [Pseudomonadota bacterium]
MNFHSDSVFQAICHGHACEISFNADENTHSASLVCISNRAARIKMKNLSPLPCTGDNVALRPHFLDNIIINSIEARVAAVQGSEVQLRFSTPLPLTGSKLYMMTTR